MNVTEQLRHTLHLITLERQADLEQYRQKVLLRSLTQRTQEGTTWYPVTIKRNYIGTGERLILEMEKTNHLDQPHAFQSGKLVSLFSNATGNPERDHINGVVNYVRGNQILVTLNSDELPDWLDDRLVGIDVMFDEMVYREMEATMHTVIKADGRLGELRQLLLGDQPARRRSAHGIEAPSTLNKSQANAFRAAGSADDVAFIHGPPGTGKTTTLIEVIRFAIGEERQVLVCAPSNAAVDLLADRLDDLRVKVLRIGHPARVTEQTLSKTLDARIAAHANFSELRTLRKKMEQVKSKALTYKRHFGHHEKAQRRALLHEAKILKSDADMLEFYIINDLLQTSEAICCTLIGASHPVLRNRKFKTVFIDEAAQALEPACWIPLLRSARVIFAGDHQQLPPTIKSREAAKLGLAQTLFEKSIVRQPAAATLLRIQYRMHEDIMKFPSAYFYDNQLIADPTVKNRLLAPNQLPIEFIDTAGSGYTEVQDPETLSRYNEQEADLVIRQTEKLVEEIGLDRWTSDQFTIGVITPYRAQVDQLQKLADASSLLEPVRAWLTINTVDAFQGQERDVIVISFVRSNDAGDVGFLGDIRRTNVAMTRAKMKLIMIGDSATLGSHPFYTDLLNYVQANASFRSVYEL
jgi:ATP-dependent RNA/DNA helicase IGHMBP2